MKISFFVFLPFLLLCSTSSKAQTASSSITNSESVQYTVSNSSGLSIKNNGSLRYQGSLNSHYNSVKKYPSAEIRVDNKKYSPPSDLIESVIDNDNNRQKISDNISEAVIPPKNIRNKINLSFTTTVPSVIGIKVQQSLESKETVDAQSLSIFPSAFPSVF
jgi:hypothetical protein